MCVTSRSCVTSPPLTLLETLHPGRTLEMVPSLGLLHPPWGRCPRPAAPTSFGRRNVALGLRRPRRVWLPDILRTRHPACSVRIRNMPEDAHHPVSAEGQYPVTITTYTMGQSTEESREDEDDFDPSWGISRLEGSRIWALIARI